MQFNGSRRGPREGAQGAGAPPPARRRSGHWSSSSTPAARKSSGSERLRWRASEDRPVIDAPLGRCAVERWLYRRREYRGAIPLGHFTQKRGAHVAPRSHVYPLAPAA